MRETPFRRYFGHTSILETDGHGHRRSALHEEHFMLNFQWKSLFIAIKILVGVCLQTFDFWCQWPTEYTVAKCEASGTIFRRWSRYQNDNRKNDIITTLQNYETRTLVDETTKRLKECFSLFCFSYFLRGENLDHCSSTWFIDLDPRYSSACLSLSFSFSLHSRDHFYKMSLILSQTRFN